MYKVIISGVVPDINKDQFLKELEQHGDIETLELSGNEATVTVRDRVVAESLHIDYNGRYLRGKPVTARIES